MCTSDWYDSFQTFFLNCNKFSPKRSGHKNVLFLGDTLISYYAWSNNENYDFIGCLEAMIDRKDPDNLPNFNWKSFEQNMFIKRFRLLNSNNKYISPPSRVIV